MAAVAGAQGSLSGTVTAAGSGIPLPESRVIVVGTSLFASTGPDGKYRIARVPAGVANRRAVLCAARSSAGIAPGDGWSR